MVSDTLMRRDYSSGVYPQKAIIKARDSYMVVDAGQRVDAQHVRLMLDAKARDNQPSNTLGQARAELHVCMADYRRAQLLAALEAQNTQETTLQDVSSGVVERMAELANVYDKQAKRLYVAEANDLRGDDYSRWHAHREALKQAAFDIRVMSRKRREDLESSLRNLKIAYEGDLRRSERALVAYPAAGLDAKRKVLLRVNRDIDLLLSLFNNSPAKDVRAE